MAINYNNIISGSFYKHGQLWHTTPLSESGHFQYFQHGQPFVSVVGFFNPPVPVVAEEEEEEEAYAHNVMGVAAGSISTVMGVAKANISKVSGV
jgi:hypothetical protein